MSHTTHATRGRLTEADCRVEDLVAVLDDPSDASRYPHAVAVEQGVLIYETSSVLSAAGTDAGRWDVRSELVDALTDGPGVVVFRGAFADRAVVDRATAAFEELIAEQRAA